MKKVNLIKLLTVFVLSMAVLVCYTGVFAEETADTPAVKTAVSSNEYAFLDALDMLSGQPLYEEDEITRAEFSYVVARLAGYRGGSYSSEKTFTDVKDSEYYYDAVNYLYDMNVVRGSAYRIFQPDSKISYNEMACIAVRALGYEEIAFAKYGNEPLCYVRMADYLDLYEGIKIGDGTSAVSTNDAIAFLKNIALAPTAQVEVFGGESSEFVFNSKNTLIYVNYGIAYDEGVVYDNGLTSIDGASSLKPGAAVIGDVTLRTTRGKFDISGYIGMYVDFYYDEKEKALVYAEQSGTGNTLTITYDRLIKNSSEFSHKKIVYYDENDKQKTAEISMNASMIYNGVAYPGYSLAELKIKSGYMTLIDNGSDKVYDIITVVEYDDRYVTSYDKNSNTIYTETGTIKLEDYKSVVITDMNGMNIDTSLLNTNALSSVVASKDNTSIRVIYCASAAKSGKVTAIDDDYVYVDDVPYTMSYSFEVNKGLNLPDSQDPIVGREYKFLINPDGDIVKVCALNAQGWYNGYCIGIATDGGNLSTDIKARMFMLDKTLFEPYFKEYIKLNGDSKSVRATDLLSSDLFFTTNENGEKTPIRQPLKFKLNNWGEIIEIETALDIVSVSEQEKDQEFKQYPFNFNTEKFSKDMYYKSVRYKGDNVKAINGMYFVSNNTLIIYDPYMLEDNPGYQIEDIEVLSPDDLKYYSSFDEAYLYDIDAALNVGIMVFGDFGASGGDDYWATSLLLVDKVSKVLDDEGVARKCISGVSYGQAVKYYEEKEGIIPDNLKQGDVCKFNLTNGELRDIQILKSLEGEYSEPEIMGSLSDTTWSNAYGPVYSVSENSLVIVGPDNSEYGKLIGFSNNNGGTKVSIYDRQLKKVSVGSWNDVYTNLAPNNVGDVTIDDTTPRVFIYRRYDYAREIVIIK